MNTKILIIGGAIVTVGAMTGGAVAVGGWLLLNHRLAASSPSQIEPQRMPLVQQAASSAPAPIWPVSTTAREQHETFAPSAIAPEAPSANLPPISQAPTPPA